MKKVGVLMTGILMACSMANGQKKSQALPDSTIVSAVQVGARGDAVYKHTGNPFLLQQGTDNASAFAKLIKQDAPAAPNNLKGGVKYIPGGVYKTTGSMIVTDPNLFIKGDNVRVTTIHPVYDFKDRNASAVQFGNGKLLRGGGMSDLTLQSEVYDNVRNNGLVLDHVEYMSFENLSIEGFNKSAIKGGVWESFFTNVTIFGCGGGITGKNGIPETGVIDFNAGFSKNPDASNNTLFTKLTLSSCNGTHINLVAAANTTENIHFNGFYDETDPGDAGAAAELPKIYMKGAANISFVNGFVTVNSTGQKHASTILRIDDDSRNGKITFSNFHFNMNPSAGYQKRLETCLRSVMEINGKNSRVFLDNVTISDPADMVGFGIKGSPPLFEGNGTVSFSRIEVNVRSASIGGTRNIGNVFSPMLNVTGWVDWRPYDSNGPVTSEFSSYYFEAGKIVKEIRRN